MISPAEYIPKLVKPEPLGPPLKATVLIDRSGSFDLPFQIAELPRMTLHDLPQKMGDLGSRSLTEHRALTLAPTFFRAAGKEGFPPKVYTDILIKGGGADVSPVIGLKKRKSNDQEDQQFISNVVVRDGIETILRYHTEPLRGLTSFLGVHSIGSGLSDHYMSQYLSSQGLRTRELIAAWEIPDDQIISTEKGLISIKEFKELTGVKPGLEAWAMGCKFRLRDVSRLIYEVEELPKYSDPDFSSAHRLNFMRTPIKFTEDEDGPAHKFNEKRFNNQQLEIIQSNLIFLAKQIRARLVYDGDSRFSALPENHLTISNTTEARSFYHDYVKVFSEILGEQFAIMDLSDVVSGMLNAQNVTLDAAIVDHDVSMKHGQVMSTEGKLVDVDPERLKHFRFDPDNYNANFPKQLIEGYSMVQTFMKELNSVGMTDQSDEEIISTLKLFFVSFLKKMSDNPERRSQRLKDIRSEIDDLKTDMYVEQPDATLNNNEFPPIQHIEDPFHNDGLETLVKIFEQVLSEQPQ